MHFGYVFEMCFSSLHKPLVHCSAVIDEFFLFLIIGALFLVPRWLIADVGKRAIIISLKFDKFLTVRVVTHLWFNVQWSWESSKPVSYLKFIEFWEEIGVVFCHFYMPLFTFMYLIDWSPYMIMLKFFKSTA